MLNILFVGQNTFPEGTATTKRQKHIIDYLIAEDVRTAKYSSWKSEQLQNPEEGYYKDKVYFKNTQYPRSVLSLFRILFEGRRFLGQNSTKNGKNAIIFCSALTLEQFAIWMYAKFKGYKIFFDVVENFNAEGGDQSLLSRFCSRVSRYAHKKATGLFVISSSLDKICRKQNPRICLLPNSAEYGPDSEKEHFSTPFKVVYAGSYASKDGIQFLIEGFDRFTKNEDVSAELILIGAGKTDSRISTIIRQNRHIHQLGYVSDETLYEQLGNADVLAMTRCNSAFANYGFPFKLSEYLATGNTVMATNVGDVTGYLTDKVNAYIIPPEDSEAIAETLLHIYTHEAEAVEIGKKGQKIVQTQFDKNINGLKFLNFIKQQVADQAAPGK